MNFKKIISVTNALFLSAVLLAGCSSSDKEGSDSTEKIITTVSESGSSSDNTNETKNDTSDGDPYSIVCTIFPEYDWVREIVGSHADNAEITYLLDNGVDLHSYQPTANDIIKISNCDLFIYVGGESDEWVEDVLEEAKNPDMQVIFPQLYKNADRIGLLYKLYVLTNQKHYSIIKTIITLKFGKKSYL